MKLLLSPMCLCSDYSDAIGGEVGGDNSKLMMSEVGKFIKLRTNLEELEEEQAVKRFAVATRR